MDRVATRHIETKLSYVRDCGSFRGEVLKLLEFRGGMHPSN
jgi:hypothetical protein